MKAEKSGQHDPFAINRQLENAYLWLRSNGYIKNAAELGRLWGVSRNNVSAYMKKRRPLGLVNATKFDKKILQKHNLNLEAFTTDILIKQARRARKPSSQDIATLFNTHFLRLEGGQEITLDKLAELEKQFGELRELVTKLIGIVSPGFS